jgi:chromatin remodeling complex protein RSC6
MAPRKSAKNETSTAAPVETPVVAEHVTDGVSTPVEAVETVETVEVATDKFVVVLELLQRWATDIKNATALVKTLQKEHQKVQKASVKKPKKTVTSSEGKARTPSGFAKPTKLSDELCGFLGVPAGSQLARTEVTRVLNEYIKKNNLQDANDKRTIVPDTKLSSILKLQGGDKLTYFNLQTYIKHHFHKDA